MLRDIERKVLRILWNFLSSRRRMLSFKELSVKTGKHENEIKFILCKLKEAGFIDWDDKYEDTIRIIRGWEDDSLH